MKKLTLIIVALMFVGGAMAQKNRVTFSPLGLVYKNIPLSYERVLGEKISVELGVGFRIPSYLGGNAGSAFADGISENGGNASIEKVRGFSFTPQFKFYPGKKGECRGFYLAPYYRYSRYRTGAAASFTDGTGFTYTADFDIKYRTSGLGLQLGARWLIKDRVAIDFFYFGPRYDFKNVKIDVTSNANLDWDAVTEDYREQFEGFSTGTPIDNFLGTQTVESKPNGVEINVPFRMPNYRFGLSFGYAF